MGNESEKTSNEPEARSSPARGGGTRRALSWLLPVMVLLVATFAGWWIVTSTEDPDPEPRAEREVRVRTVGVRREPHRLDVHGRGIVRPAEELSVFPEVSGRILEVHPRLEPGGLIEAGERLARIEEEEFRLAVEEARAALTDARARLALERGRQEVAREEWTLFHEELGGEENGEPSARALREPQLELARGEVEAAEARLARARLNLARTEIVAPFDAIVLRERASRGQRVGPQSEIAALMGAKVVWVEGAVRTSQIDFIAIPGVTAEEGSVARIRLHVGEDEIEWSGRVVRLLPELSREGLMARVLVEVAEPFKRTANGEPAGRLPLLVNESVRIEFEGRRVEELIEVPRAALREGKRLYVFEEGRLSIRRPEIAWRLPESLLVRNGLEDGERVVVSPVPTPAEGLKLREEGSADERE